MKRHWTISRQQNSLYFCVGSSRMQEWSDDSPRARAHVYVRLALPLMLAWKSLVGTIKTEFEGQRPTILQSKQYPDHNTIVSQQYSPQFRWNLCHILGVDIFLLCSVGHVHFVRFVKVIHTKYRNTTPRLLSVENGCGKKIYVNQNALNPLSPSIHIQILQSDFHSFP